MARGSLPASRTPPVLIHFPYMLIILLFMLSVIIAATRLVSVIRAATRLVSPGRGDECLLFPSSVPYFTLLFTFHEFFALRLWTANNHCCCVALKPKIIITHITQILITACRVVS